MFPIAGPRPCPPPSGDAGKGRAAFSLLGVLAAAIILCVVSIPLITLVRGSAFRSRGLAARYRAVKLAFRILDYFAAVPSVTSGLRSNENLVFSSLIQNDIHHLLPLTTLTADEKKCLIDGVMKITVQRIDDVRNPGDVVPIPGLAYLVVRVVWSTENRTGQTPKSYCFEAKQVIKVK